MTELAFGNIHNPATIQFEKLAERVGDKIKVRRIADGGGNPNLDQIFHQSLLGDRLSGHTVDKNELSTYEKMVRNDPNLNIHTVIDFDGVLVSPAYLQEKAGFENMLWLARVAKASNKTTVWTNRFQPREGRFSKSGQFPFLGTEVSRRIVNIMGEEGSGEILKKNISGSGNGRTLITMSENSDIVIFVGSGTIDRNAVYDYLNNGGNPDKLTYYDTGHLIL